VSRRSSPSSSLGVLLLFKRPIDVTVYPNRREGPGSPTRLRLGCLSDLIITEISNSASVDTYKKEKKPDLFSPPEPSLCLARQTRYQENGAKQAKARIDKTIII
jgi:hypothetical protein